MEIRKAPLREKKIKPKKKSIVFIYTGAIHPSASHPGIPDFVAVAWRRILFFFLTPETFSLPHRTKMSKKCNRNFCLIFLKNSSEDKRNSGQTLAIRHQNTRKSRRAQLSNKQKATPPIFQTGGGTGLRAYPVALRHISK